MKKIKLIGKCTGILLFLCLTIFLEVIQFTTTEKVWINVNNNSKIINGDSLFINMTKNEIQFLENTLKDNYVLKLFVIANSDKEISSEIAKSHVKTFCDDEIPYTVFFYKPTSRVLKSISSKDVSFKDISIENVEYTEVYKYLLDVESNCYILRYKQNIVSCIVLIFFIIIAIILFINLIYKLVIECKWIVTNDFSYKPTFCEKRVKVKFNKKEQKYVKDIQAMVKSKRKNKYFVVSTDDYKDFEERVIRVVYESGKQCDYTFTKSTTNDRIVYNPIKYFGANEPKFRYSLKN